MGGGRDKRTTMNYLLVFVGGGMGAVARFFAVSMVGKVTNHVSFLPANLKDVPWGTLLVNWVGALLIGLIVEFFALKFSGNRAMNDMLRYFLVVGVLGGFTTFSAFSLETYLLFLRGDYGLAILYILLSVLGSVGLVAAGIMLGRAVF